MTAKDVILQTYALNDILLNSYLGDLTDAELLIRPIPGQNHIAWQLGHLIASENHMVESVAPGKSPALPEGFAEAHNTKNGSAQSDDPAKFKTKDEYLALYKAQRAATIEALKAFPEAELDAPGPEATRSYMPTNGSLFNMIGGHITMHVGQFVSVRRKLGKPVTI